MRFFRHLQFWRRTPMVDCEVVMRQLWDYLDGELTPDTVHAIEQHLAMCQRCAPEADYQRAFLAALAAVPVETPDIDRVRERVTAALEAHGFSRPS